MNPPGRLWRPSRDLAVNLGLFGLAAGFVLLTADIRHRSLLVAEPEWLLGLDQALGALSCAALFLRRRWPTRLAVVLVLLTAVFETVGGAMLVALFTVAIHRAPARTAVVFALSLVSATCFVLVRPDPEGSAASLVWMLGLAAQSAAVGWGLFVRHRRQLIASLREQARRAGMEADIRAEQAQRRARDEIAREIHDVLGHRLSLLSVHAGALEYRRDAPSEDVARAAAVIRENAHQALQDLREVLGVLRAPNGEGPSRTVADLPGLVAESEQAGMSVDFSDRLAEPVPERLGRTLHRIVQEGLTNARKHAAGQPVSIVVAGRPGVGVTATLVNPAPAVARSAAHEGQGLLGLGERVALLDGRMDYGRTAEGDWRLHVWLPWSS